MLLLFRRFPGALFAIKKEEKLGNEFKMHLKGLIWKKNGEIWWNRRLGAADPQRQVAEARSNTLELGRAFAAFWVCIIGIGI